MYLRLFLSQNRNDDDLILTCFFAYHPAYWYAQLKKRDLQIVDQSLYAVKLTLWDRFAEMFDSLTDSVVAFKGVKVSDYNGRNWENDWPSDESNITFVQTCLDRIFCLD